MGLGQKALPPGVRVFEMTWLRLRGLVFQGVGPLVPEAQSAGSWSEQAPGAGPLCFLRASLRSPVCPEDPLLHSVRPAAQDPGAAGC